MIERLIASLPKGLLGLLGIGAGLFLITIIEPPKTLCDIQIEIFEKNQEGYLYQERRMGQTFEPKIKKSLAECAHSNSMGGCFAFFRELKRINRDLKALPGECGSAVGSQVKKYLFTTLKLMTELAWGNKPPVSYASRNGWLSGSEIAIYCRLKNQVIRLFGEKNWEALREELFVTLPGSDKLGRTETWNRSIMSVRCESYR